MADIPQEVREAAARIAAVSELRPILLSGEADDHLYIEVCHAMFLAGKRAGMERAAEIAEADNKLCDCHAHSESECACGAWWDSKQVSPLSIAQAIRSENDGR